MKKLSVLLVAAAVAISASAGVQHKLSRSLNTNKMVNKEMAQPNGMTIKVTTYTDGTTSAVKVVK